LRTKNGAFLLPLFRRGLGGGFYIINMLTREELTNIIRSFEPEVEFPEGKQLLEVIVPAEKLFTLAEKLKSDSKTAFNYLITMTAVDFLTQMTVVYHLESTEFRHLIVLKSVLSDRENSAINSLTALYPTAEYFEREVLPFAPDAWMDREKDKIGYEIPFTKFFYEYKPLRDLKEIMLDIEALEEQTEELLEEIKEVAE